MTEDRDEQHKGFKVHDRRRFSESGEPRDSAEASDAEPEAPAAEREAAAREAEAHDAAADAYDAVGQHAHQQGAAPEINFPTFVISLCTQALAHLGEIPDPATGTISADLNGARQLIDILAILQEKTRGNLDADESTLIEQALYDLRIRFVERAQKR
jgi:hypothetical protein